MSSLTRFLSILILWICAPLAAAAQDLGGQARFLEGALRDLWRGGAELRLEITQGVPWRVFTLSNPNRLVLDFREVDWGAADPDALAGGSDRIGALRMGRYQPGWSRMVAELEVPMAVRSAALTRDEARGRSVLTLRLEEVSQEAFDAAAGHFADPRFDLPAPARVTALPRAGDRIVVVLDPGHGGIDPGAENGTARESDLMLTFARELRDVLRRAGGMEVHLTRDDDYFVSLERRVALAREAGADLFISLHADALAAGEAHGAAVYTLADEASDAASAALAERHDRDDLLAGIDLTGTDDRVAGVLMDLARLENAPRSRALSRHLVAGIENAVGRLHKRPERSAGFSVLKAADIPSVLIELGFLTSEEDLDNLLDPIWRQGMAAGIRDGIQAWALEDAGLAPLRRK